MPKYLIQASYTVDGFQGLLEGRGWTGHHLAAASRLSTSPSATRMLLWSLTPLTTRVRPRCPWRWPRAAPCERRSPCLMTPEEMDQATKKSVSYRPPGR